MRLTHDPKANVAYIRLREKSGDVETIRITDDLLIDMSPASEAAGDGEPGSSIRAPSAMHVRRLDPG